MKKLEKIHKEYIDKKQLLLNAPLHPEEVQELMIESYNAALKEAVKKISVFKFRGGTEEYIIEEVQENILGMQIKTNQTF